MLVSLTVIFRPDRVIGLATWRCYYLNLGLWINVHFSNREKLPWARYPEVLHTSSWTQSSNWVCQVLVILYSCWIFKRNQQSTVPSRSSEDFWFIVSSYIPLTPSAVATGIWDLLKGLIALCFYFLLQIIILKWWLEN